MSSETYQTAAYVDGSRSQLASVRLDDKAAPCLICGIKMPAGITARSIRGFPVHEVCVRGWGERRSVPTPRHSPPVVETAPQIIGSIAGLALPFGQVCSVAAQGRRPERSERFAHTAFDASIARGGQTVQMHHSRVPIPGTVEMYTDNYLRFRLRVHDTPLGREAIAKVRNGTFCGASIAFKPIDERWGQYVCDVVEAELVEISLTDRPAWYGTQVWLE